MVTFNGIDRLIEVTDSNDVALDVEQDIYSAWKLWSQDGDNGKYAPAMRTFGGDGTAPGQTAPKYFFLQNFWRVYINNGNVVSIGLNLYTDDFDTPYIVAAGSGVSDRNSDAVNVNEEDIKNQSFLNGRVYIDATSGEAGIAYPIGTPTNPVLLFSDAHMIATSRKLRAYQLESLSLTLAPGDIIAGTRWFGYSPHASELTISGQSTVNCTFENLELKGTLNGFITATDCDINSVVNLSGLFRYCGLSGTIVLDNTSTRPFGIINAHSEVAGLGRPIIDANGVTTDIYIRGYFGGLTLKNVTQPINVSFDGDSATLEIDSSCTAGSINVGGMTQLIDNSGPGCTVTTDRTVTTLTSGGALSVEQAAQLSELWQILGLDSANPLTMEVTQHTVGGITLGVVCNPDNSVTITRQP